MKFVIGNLYTVYLAVNKKQASSWRVLSAENLKSPLTLPVLMTKGPRWNTHAIIGTLGPFRVTEKLEIEAATANASAESWIAVIYSFPTYETIATLESNKLEAADGWGYLPLKPGRYSIGWRYYDWREAVELPAVKVDGKLFAEASSVSPKVNEFYDHLSEQGNGFYTSLHYYIYTILKWRKFLPEAFVKTEYLPVGSPDTQFLYGPLQGGQALKVEVEPQIVNSCNLYLTIYDRSSFPIGSYRLDGETNLTKPRPREGYYLIRIRHKSGGESMLALSSIEAEATEQEDAIAYLKITLEGALSSSVAEAERPI